MRSIITATIISVLTASACNTPHIKNSENKLHAMSLLKALENGATIPLAYINPNKYIQHNLAVPDGLEGVTSLIKKTAAAGTKVETIRCFEDGSFVFTHTIYSSGETKVGFDIFRFEDGKIVEHWDNLQTNTKPNPSGRTLTDGATECKDPEKTSANKTVVRNFVEDILVNGRIEKISSYFDGGNYLQHNPFVADSVSGLENAIVEWEKQGITMKYDTIHKVLGEGNFVLVVSEGYLSGKHVSFYDLFRVEKDKIAEHWDIIEEIPAQELWKNNNGKF